MSEADELLGQPGHHAFGAGLELWRDALCERGYLRNPHFFPRAPTEEVGVQPPGWSRINRTGTTTVWRTAAIASTSSALLSPNGGVRCEAGAQVLMPSVRFDHDVLSTCP